MQPNRAVFLDRDGTINPDPGYISSPDQITELLPGVIPGLKAFKKMGYLLVVISNQSGVARGLIEPETLPLVNEKINTLLKEHGVQIDHFEMCTHMPEGKYKCRKPKTGLIIQSANKLDIHINSSIMIGDRITDLQCGLRAGCKSVILTRTGDGKRTESELPENFALSYIADDLLDAAEFVAKL